MNPVTSLPLPLLLLLLPSCVEESPPPAASNGDRDRPVLAAVNYPLAYFAERLAGDFATIHFEIPPNEDPAFWNPSDKQVTAIQEADLILLNGAGYAKWTSSRTLPFESTVVTSSAFENKLIRIEGDLRHSHKPGEEEHSHAGTAFTTWLDFKQASAQASEIARALTEQYPTHRATVLRNLADLQRDLEKLDLHMFAATELLKEAPVIASHPIYHYWARAHGLEVHALLWEPEMELTQDALADLEALQDQHPGVKYFLWEGEPNPGHVAVLADLGLTSFVLSPCANRPENGDFLTVMQANIASLESLGK